MRDRLGEAEPIRTERRQAAIVALTLTRPMVRKESSDGENKKKSDKGKISQIVD